MRIVGLVLLLLGLMMGIGSNLPAFIDPPSIIIILSFGLGALWISGASIPGMVRALGSAELSAEERARAAAAWGLAAQVSVASGAVGVLVGAVIMLRNIDDISAIGPGAAICIMTILYGMILGYGICRPCQRYVEDRAAA